MNRRRLPLGRRGLLHLLPALTILIAVTMLRAPLLQAVLLGPDSLFPPPEAHAMTVLRHGRAVTVPVQAGTFLERLSFVSPALGGHLEVYSIYLPPGYTGAARATRRYPVLYLLHGAPGAPGDWLHGMHAQWMEDRGIAVGTLPPLIMIMPEGNGGVFHDSQYVNTAGGFRIEDAIARDLVRYVDAHYRTIPDRRARAIAGISEGGYGAMNLGLTHVDTFGTIASISGYFAASPAEVLPGNDPWHNDGALMRANSPLLYAPRLAGLRDTTILIMDNTSDGAYTQAARHFDAALTRYHIAHTLELQHATALTAHYWPYWKAAFPTALAYIGHHLLTR